jgi:hypothetical protein
MNTSFSKKRYIAEVNQRLEERYLTEKINFVLNEQFQNQSTYANKDPENQAKLDLNKDLNKIREEFRSKYPGCFERYGTIKGNIKMTFYTDGTYRDSNNIFTKYYSNGTYETPKGTGQYTCEWAEDVKGTRLKEIKKGPITSFIGDAAGSNADSLTSSVWPDTYSCITSVLKTEKGKDNNGQEFMFAKDSNGNIYYPTGKYRDKANTTYGYKCDGKNIVDVATNKMINVSAPNSNNKIKWRLCNKGPYVVGCYGPKIKEVQGCLINIHKLYLGPRKDDSYFGKNTLTALKSKFQQFSTGFTDADIATICNKTATPDRIAADDSDIDSKYENTPTAAPAAAAPAAAAPAASASTAPTRDQFNRAMSYVPGYNQPDEKVY